MRMCLTVWSNKAYNIRTWYQINLCAIYMIFKAVWAMESDHEEQKVNPKYLCIMLRTINININI